MSSLPFTKNNFKIKGNTISLKPLNDSGKIWLEKTLQLLKVQEYGKESVRNYIQELPLLFKHYNNIPVEKTTFDMANKQLKTFLFLTGREMEVFLSVAKGLSNKQIADNLFVSLDTIETHTRSVIEKLEPQNMKHAITIGFRKKIIK